MTLLPEVFKAYDIRGLYGDEIDEEGAERVGRAFVAVTGASRVAVGHDVRLSSPGISAAFIRGALSAGADVTALGLAATEMVYFAVDEGGYDAGAVITASHNPPAYTGAKMVSAGALPLSGDTGISEIGRLAMAGEPGPSAAPGSESVDDGLLGRFVDRCMQFVDPSAITGLKVVLDAANGMAGVYLPPVLERISIDAVLQREPAEGERQTDIVLLTHVTLEHRCNDAIARIEALATVLSRVTRIRLEDFN